MVLETFDAVFGGLGYRFYGGEPGVARIYYRYYKEGFHVVIALDVDENPELNPDGIWRISENIRSVFYRPQGILSDFPDGFPVYHVEALTLLYGNRPECIRQLCAVCPDTWGYLGGDERLLIYENQPGEFWGLRNALENMETGKQVAQRPKLPAVTVGLIAINVLIFLVQELLGDTTDGSFVLLWGGLYPPLLAEEGQWWRLLTAGFLHFGAEHLVNNMVILYCMGERLEQALGHGKMLVIYLLSLLGGSLLSYAAMLVTGSYAISAGASGAIYGVIGGVLWVVIRHHGRYAGISTKRMIFMLVLTVYYGFISAGIDNWGHIGGVLTGFCATAILYRGTHQKD